MSKCFNPLPWKLDGEVVRDAQNGVVVSSINPCGMATRRLIVESVNAWTALKDAGEKLGRNYTPEAVLANAPWGKGEIEVFTLKSYEQLRDLIRRLAQALQMARLEGFGGPKREALLDEARETLATETKEQA